MPNTLIHTEPQIDLNMDRRSIAYVWEVSTTTDEHGKVTRELAVLTALHTGRRSFSASLSRQTETKDPTSPFTSRGFMPFDSIGIRSEPVARYSAKGLAYFAALARAHLVARADEPRVAAVFGVEDEAPDGPCILSDADILAGSDDDCTTHDHEAPAWSPAVSVIAIGF